MTPWLARIMDIGELILMVGSILALVRTTKAMVESPDKERDKRIAELEAYKDSNELWKSEIIRRLNSGSDHFAYLDSMTSTTFKGVHVLLGIQLGIDDHECVKKVYDEMTMISSNPKG